MYLKKLSLINFKNYEQEELVFSPCFNCILGNNGEGKTNLLDAIYYLSLCKSFLNPIDSQNIRHNQPMFMLQGEFEDKNTTDTVHCGVKRGQKKQFKRNKKPYEKLADHIGLLPLVVISPSDSALINEGSEVRRKFLDGVIAQHDKAYLGHLLTYNRILIQRNTLLKHFAERRSFDLIELQVWDEQLAEPAAFIHNKRQEFIQSFTPIFNQMYKVVSGGKESVSIEYDSQLTATSINDLLVQSLEKDRYRQHTTCGIHKDDVVFKLSNYATKKYGSQGQQKTFLIALKLAQFNYLANIKKCTPILLLDDIFDKLDNDRVTALMKLVSGPDFGQVFITDTGAERLPMILDNLKVNHSDFRIKEGKILNETIEHATA